MTALGILWYLLVIVLMVGYFVLDGFDLGAGVLSPFIARDKKEKDMVASAVGPVWDGNEVWLLTAGGALFAAFAPAYAAVFSGFYLAIMLVLLGLILRAVALEFRAHEESFGAVWDVLFFVGSLLPALLFGVALGNIVAGVPLNAHGDYTGGFFNLLNPFALLCGLLGLVHTMVQGSSWLALKAPEGSDLRNRAACWRGRLAIADAMLFVIVTAVYLLAISPQASYDVAFLPLAAVAGVIYIVTDCVIVYACRADAPRRDLVAHLSAAIGAALIVVICGATLFPLFVPGTSGAASLGIANCAATDATLVPMTVIACIGVPIMLVYHVLLYRSFRGRVDDSQG